MNYYWPRRSTKFYLVFINYLIYSYVKGFKHTISVFSIPGTTHSLTDFDLGHAIITERILATEKFLASHI